MLKDQQMKIKVAAGQTIEDVAIERYGTVEGAILIMQDNNLSPDDLLIAGQELEIRDTVPNINDKNVTIKDLVDAKNIRPNSGIEGIRDIIFYVEDEYVEDDYFEEQ